MVGGRPSRASGRGLVCTADHDPERREECVGVMSVCVWGGDVSFCIRRVECDGCKRRYVRWEVSVRSGSVDMCAV